MVSPIQKAVIVVRNHSLMPTTEEHYTYNIYSNIEMDLTWDEG